MRVLVIEDQPVAALLLCRLLEKMGHEVVRAADGLEAWETLEADDIRLVVTDWVMPRMDGLEICRRIRERQGRPYTYVILLTSRDRDEDRLEGLRAGADDFLSKPPKPAELAVRLEIAQRILSVQEELEQKNAQLAMLAAIDPLTGLRNRRAFAADLLAAAAHAERRGSTLSAIMLDVDRFKHYNDSYGHPAGDEVLRTIGRILLRTVRADDLVTRYGGEEFAVLLPSTGMSDAVILADRIRVAIEEHAWALCSVTASLGVAALTPCLSYPFELIEQADRALYRAKRLGRNRVAAYHHEISSLVEEPSLSTP